MLKSTTHGYNEIVTLFEEHGFSLFEKNNKNFMKTVFIEGKRFIIDLFIEQDSEMASGIYLVEDTVIFSDSYEFFRDILNIINQLLANREEIIHRSNKNNSYKLLTQNFSARFKDDVLILNYEDVYIYLFNNHVYSYLEDVEKEKIKISNIC